MNKSPFELRMDCLQYAHELEPNKPLDQRMELASRFYQFVNDGTIKPGNVYVPHDLTSENLTFKEFYSQLVENTQHIPTEPNSCLCGPARNSLLFPTDMGHRMVLKMLSDSDSEWNRPVSIIDRRQCGQTTMLAIYVAYHMMRGKKALVVDKKSVFLEEIHDKVIAIFEYIGIQCSVKNQSIETESGSVKFVVANSRHVRGQSYDLIVISNHLWISGNDMEEFVYAVKPLIASGSKVVFASTTETRTPELNMVTNLDNLIHYNTWISVFSNIDPAFENVNDWKSVWHDWIDTCGPNILNGMFCILTGGTLVTPDGTSNVTKQPASEIEKSLSDRFTTLMNDYKKGRN